VNLLAGVKGRRILFASLYLSEGAPIGYIWWALPTILRAEGVAIDTITSLTSLLVLPWVFKFVWAPLIDTIQSGPSSIRSWIITSQLLMGATLGPLFFLDVGLHLEIIIPFLFAHAIAAATQDAAIDSLAIATVPAHERGTINGWMQVGMLTGRSVLGGGALILAPLLGNQAVILLLIGTVYSSSILLLFSGGMPAPTTTESVPTWKNLVATLRIAARQRTTWLGLLFAATGGAAYETVGALAGPFLIDRGFTKEEVGTFFALPSVLGMIIGALAGGYLADKIGKQRAVILFLTLMSADVLLLAAADAWLGMEAGFLLWVLLSLLYVCIGLFVASSYSLFMDITHPRLGATQFSSFMGATNGCESWSAYTSGKLVTAGGYPFAFLVMSVISLLTIPLVRFLRPSQEKTTQSDR